MLVRDHGLDLTQPALARELAERSDELFGSGAVVSAEGCLSFVYKAAAEIGELGDNTQALQAAIAADGLLQPGARRRPGRGRRARPHPLGVGRHHLGPNAHPLNATEHGRADGPYVTAALNGDVDNFADLKATHGLRIQAEITTDMSHPHPGLTAADRGPSPARNPQGLAQDSQTGQIWSVEHGPREVTNSTSLRAGVTTAGQ